MTDEVARIFSPFTGSSGNPYTSAGCYQDMTAATIGSELSLLPALKTTPPGWQVRRATLLDVPAVARLMENRAQDGSGLPEATLGAASRLVLTHVGLEYGEFWVAVDELDDVRAAVVLLPPRSRTHASDHIGDGVEVALRLQLGLTAAQLPDLAGAAGVAETQWMLLALAGPGAEPLIDELLAAGLPMAELHDAVMPDIALLRADVGTGTPTPPALAG